MARLRQFTDRFFMDHYRRSNSMPQLASSLKVSLVTAYKHTKRLNMAIIKPQSALGKTVMAMYRGTKTVADLADHFKVDPSRIRNYLMSEAVKSWRSTEKHIVPMPRNVAHLKFALTIEDNPKLYDDPEGLSKATGEDLIKVNTYLQVVFEDTHE